MTDFKTKTQCTGQCCQDFQIAQRSKKELLEDAANRLERGEAGAEDAAFIADMVMPLIGQSPVYPDKWRYPQDRRLTCRHFDAEQKICTVYEKRPMLCRSYPNGKPCEYETCTWDPEEAKLVSHVTSRVGWWNKPKCSQELVTIGSDLWASPHGFVDRLSARLRRVAKQQGAKMNDAVSKAAATKALTAIAQRITESGDLGELVIELAVKEAKEINEKGIEAQVSFIVDEVGAVRAEELIRGKHLEWNEVTDPEIECIQPEPS